MKRRQIEVDSRQLKNPLICLPISRHHKGEVEEEKEKEEEKDDEVEEEEEEGEIGGTGGKEEGGEGGGEAGLILLFSLLPSPLEFLLYLFSSFLAAQTISLYSFFLINSYTCL